MSQKYTFSAYTCKERERNLENFVILYRYFLEHMLVDVMNVSSVHDFWIALLNDLSCLSVSINNIFGISNYMKIELVFNTGFLLLGKPIGFWFFHDLFEIYCYSYELFRTSTFFL